MNILIVGKGKMGQLIDAKAKALGLTSFGCCDVLDPSLLQQKKRRHRCDLGFFAS